MLGVWSAASRRKIRMIDKANDERAESGPWVQVSRLGNPLFNEVVVPLGHKDQLEHDCIRQTTRRFCAYVQHPELAKLLPVLYPNVFPNLAGAEQAARRPRCDPADRDPGGDRSRVPELHREGAR